MTQEEERTVAKWSDEELIERLECVLCDPLDPLEREYFEAALSRLRELTGITASLTELMAARNSNG